MPVRPKDILSLVHAESGRAASEELCIFDDSTKQINRAVVCWMANAESIEHAASVGADLIICHESLFFPYQVEHTGSNPDFLSWPANAVRARLLAEHGITCVRIHWSADLISIYDAFARRLGLGKPIARNDADEIEGPFTRAYSIGPMTYGELIQHVQASGLPVLRYSTGDMERRIEKVGLPWGGLGLFVNIPYMQRLVELGVDAFIAGESDSYGFHFAKDSGIYMIETGHEVSENEGLREFTQWLQERLPEVEVSFYETQPAYEIGNRG